ncbi:DsrH/TusB family sulfur metabolism protein [Agitococcus lubricus]|uniref:Sulfur relay protein TusB/DsrH n=1 Tax=Agitococcus lubricus TaxID=1077255 RepID=A0A2T5IWM4_9GAMM|nr:DsrH/TusB family sulfur metabolism protein [Agitococcus lubricus]PTQ88297.1 sulfur relay protein TusB/DsrH [Agitococcus lubricus]
MSTLHIINTTLPVESELYQQLMVSLCAEDALLFLNAGIYSASLISERIAQSCYILESDQQLTGLMRIGQCHLIDYTGFVELGIQHERSISWG